MDTEIRVGTRCVGGGHPCLVIAEIGQAHDGSLGSAHAYIDAVACAGAHAVKFQTHIADAESTLAETFRVKFSPQDSTRHAYWKRIEFTEEQWAGLATHASERGLLFLSSAFSERAVDLLDRLQVPAWKVGSGEIGSRYLIERMARTRRPVLLSSGLASFEDLDRAAEWVRSSGAPLAIFQCTSMYPCPPDRWGLHVMEQMKERYRCPVGFSDHSGVIFAGLAAATLGANMLEVHVVFSRACFGPDVPASVTIKELQQLVCGVGAIEQARLAARDKDGVAAELRPIRRIFGKSVVAARALPASHRLSSDDLAFKKPGTGIPSSHVESLLGRTLKRSVARDELITEDNLD
jgi:N-acetylneuraminate synthase